MWNVSHRAPTDTIKAEAGPLQAISFIDPTPQALCRFKSGAVGLCDVSRRSWTMFGRAAHTDTVFAAAFKPADPNMLATCSFDGSVRIWDTRQSRLHRDLVGDDVGVLYAVCWAPHDETRLVTTSSRGQVHIWDVDNGGTERHALRLESHVARPTRPRRAAVRLSCVRACVCDVQCCTIACN